MMCQSKVIYTLFHCCHHFGFFKQVQFPSTYYLIMQLDKSLPEKIDANLPQRRHCPRRYSRHIVCVRFAEVSAQEVWISVLDDGGSNFAHQRKQIVHIVHSQPAPRRSAAHTRAITFFFFLNQGKPDRRVIGRSVAE